MERIRHYLNEEVWRADPGSLPPVKRMALWAVRLALVMVRELAGGQLTLRAMSLVYTTLLSLVPLLAVSFSVLKAFGVHNQVEPLLLNFLTPLGPRGEELTANIIAFVENVRVGVLGSVGLGLLLYTVISLIQKIESAFNHVWGVSRPRPFPRRFSDYLSVIMVGPVLVFSAIGMTTSLMNSSLVQTIIAIEPFGSAVVLAGKLVPYLFIIVAFTFIYLFVPNTRVHLRSALFGAVIGGVLWQTTGMLFASFASGSTRYAAIYSGFAILILFMIWLYLSWFILLFGAQISYFHQHPQQVRPGREQFRLSDRLKERVGLLVMYRVTEAFEQGTRSWTLERLVQALGLPGDALERLLQDLEAAGYLVESSDDPPAYLPGRDPGRIELAELLRHLRSAEESRHRVNDAQLTHPEVERVMEQFEQCLDEAMQGRTLKDLIVLSKSAADG